MEKYPLDALLSVRYIREDEAKNAVRAAERKVEEARQEVEKAIEELVRYQEWWPQEMDRKYEEFLGSKTNLEGLDKFRRSLGNLAEGEIPRAEAVNQARQTVTAREKELANAKQKVADARKSAAKIETHKDIWMLEAKKEAQRQEDMELDEFLVPAKESDTE